MVTHDKLFSLISSPMGVSGVYTIVERKRQDDIRATEPWFIPRSEFKLASRGTKVQFQLKQSNKQVHYSVFPSKTCFL